MKELEKYKGYFIDESGNLFNFGTDTVTPAKSRQHLLSFEIIRLEPVSKLTTLH